MRSGKDSLSASFRCAMFLRWWKLFFRIWLKHTVSNSSPGYSSLDITKIKRKEDFIWQNIPARLAKTMKEDGFPVRAAEVTKKSKEKLVIIVMAMGKWCVPHAMALERFLIKRGFRK